MSETEAKKGISCDWTVSGMDCGSCATKVKDAVARLPGVTGVEVGIMSERLRLTLDEGEDRAATRSRRTVRALGYGIVSREAMAGTGRSTSTMVQTVPAARRPAAKQLIDSGHGGPGHVHDDPADRGKRWYQTAKGRLVIFTALLLVASLGCGTDHARGRQLGIRRRLPDRSCSRCPPRVCQPCAWGSLSPSKA